MFHFRKYNLIGSEGMLRKYFNAGSPLREGESSGWYSRSWVAADGSLLIVDVCTRESARFWCLMENCILFIDGERLSFEQFRIMLSDLKDTKRRAKLVQWVYSCLEDLVLFGIIEEAPGEPTTVHSVVKVDLMDKGTPLGESVWVPVGNNLLDMIKPGCGVSLVAGLHTYMGIVSSSVVTGDGLEELLLTVDPEFPRAGLDRVVNMIPLDSITVPGCFLNSRPSPERIAKRVAEYYRNGAFCTRVLVSADGVLKDGYTAYLVARMFGLSHIPYFKRG